MLVYPCRKSGLSRAAELLRAGEVVAHPTETVYGLAADAFSHAALERLFALKGREARKAVLLIVGAQEDVSLLSPDISERARLCMQRFWPGPLSLLLPARSDLEDALVGPSGKVCVRLPALEAARDLCRAFGAPLTSTSANRSGSEPARSVEELDVPGLQAALDGGRLQASSPSTVYDPDEDVVLRQGATPAELLHSLP